MRSPAILISVDDKGEVSVIARRGNVILEITRPDSETVVQLAPGRPAMCIDLLESATA